MANGPEMAEFVRNECAEDDLGWTLYCKKIATELNIPFIDTQNDPLWSMIKDFWDSNEGVADCIEALKGELGI